MPKPETADDICRRCMNDMLVAVNGDCNMVLAMSTTITLGMLAAIHQGQSTPMIAHLGALTTGMIDTIEKVDVGNNVRVVARPH